MEEFSNYISNANALMYLMIIFLPGTGTIHICQSLRVGYNEKCTSVSSIKHGRDVNLRNTLTLFF